jgi:hypothetical protein
VWVSAGFGSREGTWAEPIDRNIWGLLKEFGDAEIAGLVLPRRLLIEASAGPTWNGAKPVEGRANVAASGTLEPAASAFDNVWAEYERLRELHRALGTGAPTVVVTNPQQVAPLNTNGLGMRALFAQLGLGEPPEAVVSSLKDARVGFDPADRMERLLRQIEEVIQKRVRTSELRRNAIFDKVDRATLESYAEGVKPLRERFHADQVGKLPAPSVPLSARTALLYDQPKWTGYAVELPVWPDVVASGILLVPKGVSPQEKRAVVVCQHGLEGHAEDVTDPSINSPYHSFGAKLADLGYVVYAPQNPYVGQDRFRQLQRKANPLEASLFSVIVRQHERTLEWLKTLPFVDAERIGFYGLSYGGKTAMRVPAIVPDYRLSICSADFNEWAVKCTSIDRRYSYMYTVEYDMYEWGLTEFANYAEMAGLIAPRPFQVERGHGDGVAPDEWIGYEFAKVKRLYDSLNLQDRVDITYFNGPHEIRGIETFAFIRKHLGEPFRPSGR